MTRMMIATALTTTLATSAFAVTEAQIDQIEAFAPGVNVAAMSESELELAYGIVSSGDTRGEKINALRSLTVEATMPSFATISEAEMLRLKGYAPDVDLMSITQSQAEAALAVSYGGDMESTKSRRIEAILTDERVIDTMADDITAGQIAMIETYAPNVDADTLSEEDVQLILSFIHSGMSRSDVTGKVKAITGS